MMLIRITLPIVLAAVFFSSVVSAAELPAKVEFNRDIRPLFSEYCFTCHGPAEKKRQSEFRLDIGTDLFEDRDGTVAVVAGHPEKSELFKRIASDDTDVVMPPADSERKLNANQIALIRKWIEQGAKYQKHWSFIAPKRPALPPVKQTDDVANPIDRFIIHRLESEGLSPSPRADKTTLIRRVTFDLTGLPPTLKEIDEFLADHSSDAYEKLVERLLKSSRYGEHMTRYWLDLARYGDTHGLHLDNERSLWPYRDWVIKAFNSNMPFDQFTVEQLAGDLMPNPTTDQLVATGFNRCNVTTSEGGAIPEEWRVRYAVDRVETTGTVWLGVALGCAVCHEHKYDPISQQEFYSFFAYFNSLTERAMDGNALLPPPSIQVPTPQQAEQKKELQEEIAGLQKEIREAIAKVNYVDPHAKGDLPPLKPREYVWIDDALPASAKPAASGSGSGTWQFVESPDHPVYSGSQASLRTTKGLGQHYFTGANPPLKIAAGDKLFAYVYLDPKNPPKEIMLQFNDGNWEHRVYWGENSIDWGKDGTASRRQMGPLPETGQWIRLEVDVVKVGLKPGAKLNGWAFTQFDGTVYWDNAGILSHTPQSGWKFESQLAWEQVQKKLKDTSLPKPVQDALKLAAEKRSAAQNKQLRDYFIERVLVTTQPVFGPLNQRLDAETKKLEQLNKTIPSTLVMKDMPKPRETFLLVRGQYDKPDKKQKLEPGVPENIMALNKDAPPTRLGLARWLVDSKNPLTARVTVNRFWQQYFGTGIVKTAEDFGSQGEWPSHPQLLDWLAVEFVESGWDVKRMQKLIVLSATYRQSSRTTPQLLQHDPKNRLLARGPRFRLDAEMVRDNALAISGLLINHIGGRSVKPYQPLGLWKAVGYSGSNTVNFVLDKEDGLYRRSMYTFWKRTSPPPTMSTFDAPSREKCTARRARTNTPLQALVLMNDIQFVEAARRLAERVMTEAAGPPQDRIAFAFRLATARRPRADESQILLDIFNRHLTLYRGDKDSALKLVSVGNSKRNESLDVGELAAWTMVANLILNLDETLTKF